MKTFFYGVIEGFYGKQWSWPDRERYAEFLATQGFECYIYAPKADKRLRSEWRKPHEMNDIARLSSLGHRYRSLGLRWGLGFSPLGLSQHYTKEDSVLLRQKVRALNDLAPDILCILFDDIRGDIADLAQRQLEITSDILAVSVAKHHIVCPTYYSFDPVLEKVFGTMPESYLEHLGEGLDPVIDIFWTGNQVISTEYNKADLDKVTRLLSRRPILWDNYPVNDGRLTSNYLHIKPYEDRPYQLKRWAAGHIVNPMNQPYLSQLVLQSLTRVYRDEAQYDVESAFVSGLQDFTSKKLGKLIKDDWRLFQELGLKTMSESQLSGLKDRYQKFEEPIAFEIVAWLNGEYVFDEECLTE